MLSGCRIEIHPFCKEESARKKADEDYWNYKMKMWEVISSQVVYLVYVGNYSRSDVLAMSPHDRKYTFDFISGVKEKEKEHYENKS